MSKSRKPEKDYYAQLDRWVSQYETKGNGDQKLSAISDKISWCWKWKKITKKQVDELCDRMIEILAYAEYK